jgi:hypothetical protein
MMSLVVKNLDHRRWLPATAGPTHSRLWRRVAARPAVFKLGFWPVNLGIL